jgi:hypothetical protein
MYVCIFFLRNLTLTMLILLNIFMAYVNEEKNRVCSCCGITLICFESFLASFQLEYGTLKFSGPIKFIRYAL